MKVGICLVWAGGGCWEVGCGPWVGVGRWTSCCFSVGR